MRALFTFITFSAGRMPCLVIFLVLLSACGSSHSGHSGNSENPGAPNSPAQSHDDTPASKTYYLAPNALDVEKDVTAPPAPGSIAAMDDMSEVLSLQKSRTTGECLRANYEVEASLESFFGPDHGPLSPLSEEEVKKLQPFFDHVKIDEKYFVSLAKHHWNRARPYDQDSDVRPCVPLESSNSYPSGHAAMAFVFADVLSLLSPERSVRFQMRARQIADDRVLGGVHFPSDIAAGQKLGDEIFELLEANSAFQSDLKKFSL